MMVLVLKTLVDHYFKYIFKTDQPNKESFEVLTIYNSLVQL